MKTRILKVAWIVPVVMAASFPPPSGPAPAGSAINQAEDVVWELHPKYSAATRRLETNFTLGLNAGKYANPYRQYSTIIGSEAGMYATRALRPTFIGYEAGKFATAADCCVFLGTAAGAHASNSTLTTLLGYSAGRYAAFAERATLVGTDAGRHATNCQYTVAVGQGAANFASGATHATLVGQYAGRFNRAPGSVMIGYLAGDAGDVMGSVTNTKASTRDAYATFVGYQAGKAPEAPHASHSIAIGANAVVTGPYQAVIGAANITNTVLQGVVRGNGGGLTNLTPDTVMFFGRNRLFVDPDKGNDATAVAENPWRPYRTVQAALAAAVAGQTVVLGPGNYAGTVRLKNGVAVEAAAGASFQGNPNRPLFIAEVGVTDVTIRGEAAISGGNPTLLIGSSNAVISVRSGPVQDGVILFTNAVGDQMQFRWESSGSLTQAFQTAGGQPLDGTLWLKGRNVAATFAAPLSDHTVTTVESESLFLLSALPATSSRCVFNIKAGTMNASGLLTRNPALGTFYLHNVKLPDHSHLPDPTNVFGMAFLTCSNKTRIFGL
ncbi:MAG TPA: hypothetical protein PKX23_05350 [Verrucomicrobiota bacterium]|nr:hypothetical protein [Verrucomicrobiota bacterium]HRT08239.1 hypothetical protein [Candidatus Paceibacterota bacterium]HRT55784.1 hypothetical protein [Candidatus Paceibacterota bacterium]